MEENKNSAISVRNVCIDYKSLKTGSIKQNFFKLKKVELFCRYLFVFGDRNWRTGLTAQNPESE